MLEGETLWVNTDQHTKLLEALDTNDPELIMQQCEGELFFRKPHYFYDWQSKKWIEAKSITFFDEDRRFVRAIR